MNNKLKIFEKRVREVEDLLEEMECHSGTYDKVNEQKILDYFKVNNKRTRVANILNRLYYAYNLPEHPEKPNGFENKYEVALEILSLFGINKPKNQGDPQ